MKLLKYIFFLLPFVSLAQSGTGHYGKININNGTTVPTERLYVNGTSRFIGAVQMNAYANGFLTVNGSGVLGVSTGPSPTTGGTGQTAVATGDLLYGSATNVWSRRAIGTTGQVLRVTGGLPTWGTFNYSTDGTGTLGATFGGTGQSSYVVGDLLYANTTTTLAKLTDIATGNALITGGVGVAPAYGKITPSHISGTWPLANGGTGNTSYTTGSIPFSNGTILTQDNANLSWNATTSYLLARKTSSDTTYFKAGGTQQLISTTLYRYYNQIESDGRNSFIKYKKIGTGIPSGTVIQTTLDNGNTGFGTGSYATSAASKLSVDGTFGVNGAITTDNYTGYPKANGASPWTASSTIPATDITGNFANSRITGTDTQVQYISGTTQTGSSTFTFDPSITTLGISSTKNANVSIASNFNSTSNLAAGSYTVNNYRHFSANQGTFAGGATDYHVGFYANSNLSNGGGFGLGIGFQSEIPFTSSSTYGLYFNGGANNYLEGGLGIGTTDIPQHGIHIKKNFTSVAGTNYGIRVFPTYTTSTGLTVRLVNSSLTLPSGSSINSLYNYYAERGTIGGTITNHYGYYASSTINQGSTRNIGYYGGLSAGATSWNLYMSGDGANYMAGALGVGTDVPTTTNGGVDIASGGIGLSIGADNGASTRTASTNKFGRIVTPTYSNSAIPMAVLMATSTATGGVIYVGGTTAGYAPTQIRLHTAANNTTTTGNEVARFDSLGRFGIGVIPAGYKMQMNTSYVTPYVSTTNQGDGLFLFNSNASSVDNNFQTLKMQVMSNVANSIGLINLVQPLSASANSAWAFQLRNSAGNYTEPMRIDGSGTVSIGKAGVAGTQKLEVVGNVLANRYINGGSAPTIAAGAGAGTTPTISVVGRDNDFSILLTTGTTPTGANAIIATVTYAGGAYLTGSIPTCTAAQGAGSTFNAALLTGSTMFSVDGTTTTMVLYSGTTALTGSTVYKFNCHSGGY